MKKWLLTHLVKAYDIAKEFWMPISTFAAVISASLALLTYIDAPGPESSDRIDGATLQCKVNGRNEPPAITQLPVASEYPSVVVREAEGRTIELFVWGLGLPSPSSTTNVQRKLTALRAAELVAKRALSEWVGGGDISFYSEVTNFSLTEDWIRSRFDGTVPSMVSVFAEYDVEAGVGKILLRTSCNI